MAKRAFDQSEIVVVDDSTDLSGDEESSTIAHADREESGLSPVPPPARHTTLPHNTDDRDITQRALTELVEDRDFLDDDCEAVQWTDEWTLQDDPHGEARAHSTVRRVWKGAEFTMLLVLDTFQNKVGLFLGIDDPSTLPEDFKLKLNFSFAALDAEDEVIAQGKEDSYLFRHSPVPARMDFGNFSAFPAEDMREVLRRSKVKGVAGLYHIRVRVSVSSPFAPRLLPRGYDSKRETDMVGLENQGATCYLNSLLQTLFHINKFRRVVYTLPHAEERIATSTSLALQTVFQQLQTSHNEVRTHTLTQTFGWTSAEAAEQQDVQEMMRLLLDKLEEKMKGTAAEGAVQDLFCGKVRSFIRCVHVPFESKREEDFYDIQVDVKGCKSLQESLRKYVSMELLDGENQYHAEQHGKQDAQKGVIFTRFPPVLTVQLKRYEFNMYTGDNEKIHDEFQFPAVLDMDEFLAADADTDTGSNGQRGRQRYVLHSVLVHAGSIHGGHYYAFVRPGTDENCRTVYTEDADPCSSAGEWFKFNDEFVSRVSPHEAMNYNFGRRSPTDTHISHSAYMLVYLRVNEAHSLMRAMRSVEEEIPRSLRVRLLREERCEEERVRVAMRTQRLRTIKYATEREIAHFLSYSPSAALIDSTRTQDWQYLEVLDECRYVGLVMFLAKRLNVSVLRIRLWKMLHPKILKSKASKNAHFEDVVYDVDADHNIPRIVTHSQRRVHDALRVEEDIDTDEYDMPVSKKCLLYVQILGDREIERAWESERKRQMEEEEREREMRESVCVGEDVSVSVSETHTDTDTHRPEPPRLSIAHFQEEMQRIESEIAVWERELREAMSERARRDSERESERDEEIEREELAERETDTHTDAQTTDTHGKREERAQRRERLREERERETERDISLGCGVGLANRLLMQTHSDTEEMQERCSELLSRILDIERRTLSLLRKYSAPLSEDHVLLFVRVYDPHNALTQLSPLAPLPAEHFAKDSLYERERESVCEELREMESIVWRGDGERESERERERKRERESASENESTEPQTLSHSPTRTSTHVHTHTDRPLCECEMRSQYYVPFKYLCCTEMKSDCNTHYLSRFLLHRLYRVLSHGSAERGYASEEEKARANVCVSRWRESVSLWEIRSHIVALRKLSLSKEDELGDYVTHGGATLVLALDDPRTLTLPLFRTHTHADAHTDAQITTQSRTLTTSSTCVTVTHTSSLTESVSPTLWSLSPAERFAELLCVRELMVLPCEARDLSVLANVRLWVAHTLSQTLPQTESIDQRVRVSAAFLLHAPSTTSLSALTQHVAARLGVHPAHLCLYLGFPSGEEVADPLPLHALSSLSLSHDTHSECVDLQSACESRGLGDSKHWPRLRLSYKILPFPVYGEVTASGDTDTHAHTAVSEKQRVVDLRPHCKTLDIVLCGERTRGERERALLRMRASLPLSLQPSLCVGVSQESSESESESDERSRKRRKRNLDSESESVIDCESDSDDEPVSHTHTHAASDSAPLPNNPYEFFDTRSLSVRVRAPVSVREGVSLSAQEEETLCLPPLPSSSQCVGDVMRSIRCALTHTPQTHTRSRADSRTHRQGEDEEEPDMDADDFEEDAEIFTFSQSPAAVLSEREKHAHPLALCELSNNAIARIFAADDPVFSLMLDDKIGDLSHPLAHTSRLALQCLDMDQLLFLRGEASQCSSMLVSVFSYTMQKGAVSPCEPAFFNGPFLCFVREDDDYASLCERLVAVSGDKSIREARLAAVDRDWRATMLSRSARPATPPEGESEREPSLTLTRQLSSSPDRVPVWETLAAKNPLFAHRSFSEAVDHLRDTQAHARAYLSLHLPRLGVLRSTAEVQAQQATRTKKTSTASGGIKMN